MCETDSCYFHQIRDLTLMSMSLSAAQMRMLLRSFPCLHTLSLYYVWEDYQQFDMEDDPQTDTEDDTQTDTEDDPQTDMEDGPQIDTADDPQTDREDDIADGGDDGIHQGRSQDAGVGDTAIML